MESVNDAQRAVAALIRNPWEITFGLPRRRLVNWFEPRSKQIGDWSKSVVSALAPPPLAQGPSVTAYGPPSPFVGSLSLGWALPWPGLDMLWRTPEPPSWEPQLHPGFIDRRDFGAYAGASVPSRHGYRRSLSEMTDAAAGIAPQSDFSADTSAAWAAPWSSMAPPSFAIPS
jgi:hypothetical protein